MSAQLEHTSQLLSWCSTHADYENAGCREIAALYDSVKTDSTARRVSETVVVKRVHEYLEREWHNLKKAWNDFNGMGLSTGARIRIPKPVRSIASHEWMGSGYIIMEYLPGNTLQNEPDHANEVAEAVCLIYQKTLHESSRPGPLDGLFAEHFPWGDGEAECVMHKMQDLENLVNKRMRINGRESNSIFLTECCLGLSHMDAVPRNFVIVEGQDIGILDWRSLYNYPAEMLIASLLWSEHNAPPEERQVRERLRCEVQSRLVYNQGLCDVMCQVQSSSINNFCKRSCNSAHFKLETLLTSACAVHRAEFLQSDILEVLDLGLE